MNNKSDPGNGWKNPFHIDTPGAARLADSLLQGEILRRKTSAGLALGTFLIELPHPAVLPALALAGFDFVVLDMEHSSVDFSNLEALITAGLASGIAVLVRTWGEDIGLIGKALDMGAHGIMAPHVETPERARAIVEQARFAPHGNRGFSPLSRYDALAEPLRALNDAAYVVVQIEGRAALDRAGEIAAVPGVDAVFVGPYDLSLSLGVAPGSAEVYTAAGQIADMVPTDRDLGIFIDDPSTCGEWLARRFALQCVSFDGRMLANGARAVAVQARDSAAATAPASGGGQ